MTSPCKESEANVTSVRSTSGQGRKDKTCFSCGREGHFVRDKSCPARGKECAKCGRYGHFAACCKGDKDDHESRKPSPRQWKGSNREQRGSGKQANYVDDEQSRSTSEDDAFAFSFTEQACSVSASPERLVSVSINGITKEVLVGFGSVSNLIGKMIFQELTYQGLKAEPQKCTKKLYVYGGQELEVVGQFQAENSVVKAKVKAGFVVVKKGRCLPGYSLNIADVLSRLKNITASNGYVHDDEYVLMITLKAVPVALRMQEIEEASARDAELQVVHECLRSDGTQ